MIAAVVAGLLFASVPGLGQPWLAWLCGAVLVQLRLLANVLDGMVAVGRGVASPVGELYNEIPDRVSDTAVFAGIGFAAGSPALGWAAALAAMATAYVRATGRAAGGGSDFRGPMAKQQRMALVTALAVFCAVLRRVRHRRRAGCALGRPRPFAGDGRATAVGYCAGAAAMMGQAYGERVTVGIVAAVCAVMLIATAAISGWRALAGSARRCSGSCGSGCGPGRSSCPPCWGRCCWAGSG